MARRRSRSRRPLVLLLAAAPAGALAVVLARRRGSGASVPGLDRIQQLVPRDRLPGRLGGSRPGEEDWRCECGARYRRTGRDRHRIYWPAGAPENQPVLGTECVQCGRPLPPDSPEPVAQTGGSPETAPPTGG